MSHYNIDIELSRDVWYDESAANRVVERVDGLISEHKPLSLKIGQIWDTYGMSPDTCLIRIVTKPGKDSLVLATILTFGRDSGKEISYDFASAKIKALAWYKGQKYKAELETRYVHKTVNVRAGRSVKFEIIDRLKKWNKIKVDSIIDSWAVVYKNGIRCGYAYAPLLKDYPPPSTTLNRTAKRKGHTTTSTTYYSIKGTDDGYKWNKTDYTAKITISKDLARLIGTRDAQFYYDCLENFYDTTDPWLLEMTIAEISSMCSIM